MYKSKPVKKLFLGILAILLCITSVGSLKTISYAGEIPEQVNVLMIGNSFTKYNSHNVGTMLKELAAADGKKLSCKVIMHGSAYLSYYAFWSPEYKNYYDECMDAFKNGDYDYIILQEQTKASMENYQEKMLPAVQQLCSYISFYQPKAKVLLYETAPFENDTTTMVDGSKKLLTFQEFQERNLYGYTQLSQEVNATAIPVGMSVYSSTILFPTIPMVSSDRKHPSFAGYYLAAASFYNEIYKTAPVALAQDLSTCDISDFDLAMLNALALNKMTLNRSTLSLTTEASETLTATVTTPILGHGILSWKSLNPEIASVDPISGKVTGVSEGSTAILAETSSGLMAVCCVDVEDTRTAELSFGRKYYQLKAKDRMRLLPRIKNGTTSGSYKWSSSNPQVASVSENGTVSARRMGAATIKVTDRNNKAITASYTLYVSGGKPSRPTAAISGYTNTAGKVKLSWGKVYGATKYGIYRSTSSNGTYNLIGQSTTASYTDATGEADCCYYYKVSAMAGNILTESELSPWARIILPRTPSLAVTAAKTNSIQLTWEKNSKITGHIIYRSTKKNNGYKQIAKIRGNGKTSYTDKNVKKGTTYYYKIRSFRELDKKVYCSSYSNSMKGSIAVTKKN